MHFKSPTLRFIRVIDKLCDSGTPARRVIILSKSSIFLCQISGDTKRTIPIAAILSVMRGEVQGIEQALLRVDGDCDLLVNFCQDDRNDSIATMDEFLKHLQLMAEDFAGKRIPESRGTHLRQQSSLRKVKTMNTPTKRLDDMVRLHEAHPNVKLPQLDLEAFGSDIAAMQEAISDARDETLQVRKVKTEMEQQMTILAAQRALFRRASNVPSWMANLGLGGPQFTTNSDASMELLVRLRVANDAIRKELQDYRKLAREIQAKQPKEVEIIPDPNATPEMRELVAALKAERDALLWERRKLGGERVLATLVTTICFRNLMTHLTSYEGKLAEDMTKKNQKLRHHEADIARMRAVLNPGGAPPAPHIPYKKLHHASPPRTHLSPKEKAKRLEFVL
jgi:uncharacterized membrane protein